MRTGPSDSKRAAEGEDKLAGVQDRPVAA